MIPKIVRPPWQSAGHVPMLIVIPYYLGDFTRVLKLAKTMVALQRDHAGEKVHVCLAARQDCDPANDAFIELSKRFNVWHYRCTSPLRGYPAGANGMFSSVMSFASFRLTQKYGVVLWMEPDMAPCRQDWIDRLIAAWNARRHDVYAMGHIFAPDGHPNSMHLNGGALWSPLILRMNPEITTCAGAWDWDKRKEILKVAQDTVEIRYAHKARECRGLPNPRPSIIHGYVDDSLIEYVGRAYGFEIN